MTDRDLVSVGDVPVETIEQVLDLAGAFADGRTANDIARGKLLATLFYEPSTRTRLSFEAAMQRLGGGVLSAAEMSSSSAAKGETLHDTMQMVSGYADAVVLRHPCPGAARAAQSGARVPLVNAGDGAREHPTQALLDLFTLRRETKRARGWAVALVGDLRHARAAHSLALLLARFDARLHCVAPRGLQLPGTLLARLQELGAAPVLHERLEEPWEGTPLIAQTDAVYVMRVQRERFASADEYERARTAYRITPQTLAEARTDCVVLHPLPRAGELDPAVDSDPRAAYFRQAAYGVPVRMAVLAAMLGLTDFEWRTTAPAALPAPQPCGNEKCILRNEPNLPAEALAYESGAVCAYCEHALGGA